MTHKTRRQRIFTLGMVAGLALLLPALGIRTARAGGNNQVRDPANPSEAISRTWDVRMLPISWVLSEDGLPGSGIDNATLTSELTAAFDTWEALSTSALDFTFGGEVPIRTTGLDGPLGSGIDGLNLVSFTDPDKYFPPGVLALATTVSFTVDTVIDATNSDLDGDGTPDIPEGTYAAGTIFDGDIAFNASEEWSVSGADATYDVRAVALHEIGHIAGLAHSMIRNAVMFPFVAHDIAAARTPKADDVAYISYHYPQEPAYSATFGSISGQIRNGFNSAPVLGAHVYAADPASGASVVGAYTGLDGSYLLPGLGTGDYLVAIEPLDGDPVGLDPFRVNEVVRYTLDTNFPEEYYDANESNVEADPRAALTVPVGAGANSPGVDMVTNNLQVPGVNVILEPGYNLFAYPVEVPAGLGSFELLQAIGDDTEVAAIDRYDPATGTFERAEYVNGAPSGVDFPISRTDGYILHMLTQKVVLFSGATDCPDLDLSRGMNLIGVPCPPAGYGAFQLLQDIGARFEIESLQSFDPETGTFGTALYDLADQPTGDDFPISNGRGYLATMLADKQGLRVPPAGSDFPPVIDALTPGRAVPGTIVVILGEGFDPDVAKNTVTFNGIGASVVFATTTTITTVVPVGATTGPVRVSVSGLQSNAIDFVVESPLVGEVFGSETPLLSGQTATGILNLEGEQDRYTFTALAGSLVTVSAAALTPGVPDLVLLLEDPNGIVVTSNDNSVEGVGTDPRINNFELPTTGTYTIVVSNVPNTGLGAYNVSLTVTTRATEPKVSILGGDLQTGLGGTALPIPLSVLVTGPTGAPVSGVSVNFIATDLDIVDPTAAGTTIVETNASGIVQVDTTLPSASGLYTITVTVNGVSSPAVFNVAASLTEVATVEMVGNQQEGTVNQQLANPLEIIVRDSLGGLVTDAMIAFHVVSGGGKLGPLQSPSVLEYPTGADGTASTTYTLGKMIHEPQIVAAFVPGFPEPLLFEAYPLAGDPSEIHSNSTSFTRMTLGVSVLSAIQIQVFDGDGNPVKNQEIQYTAYGGLIVEPGLDRDGEWFADYFTDEDGIHVAMVSAPYPGAIPTIAEFGQPVPDNSEPYSIVARALGGTSPEATFNVAVDMGPNMVTAPVSVPHGTAQIIGQPLPDGANTVYKWVFHWTRNDIFIDRGDGLDEDNGDITDESFDDLEWKSINDDRVWVHFEAKREDGRNEADYGLTPMTLDGTAVQVDVNGIAGVVVTNMGDVGGIKRVVGRIPDGIILGWAYDDLSYQFVGTFTDEHDFAEGTVLNAVPVTITVDVEDLHSGVDFSSIVASLNPLELNGTTFFDGTAPPLVLPEFPEPLQIIVGGAPLTGLNDDIIHNSSFNSIRFIYQPAANRLVAGFPNEIEVGIFQPVKDRAENEQASPATATFNYP